MWFPREMMACHARRCPTICAAQTPYGHSTPYVVRSCMLSEGDYNMPHQTPYDRVCFTMAMMVCHTRRRLTVCAAQGRWWHAKPEEVLSFVFSKSDKGMPHSTSSDHVCCPRARWHAMPDVIRPCVLPKCDNDIKCQTSSHCMCNPKVMMPFHARRPLSYVMSRGDDGRHTQHSPTVCAAKGQWWHVMPVVMRPSVMSKGDDGMARATSSDCACSPRGVKANHARRRTTPCVLSKGDDCMTRPT